MTKSIFPKDYKPNQLEKIFVIEKGKNAVPWAYVIKDINGEGIARTFYEKELQKTKQMVFRIEKVIKKKCEKLYSKWKDYNNSFTSRINKSDKLQTLSNNNGLTGIYKS